MVPGPPEVRLGSDRRFRDRLRATRPVRPQDQQHPRRRALSQNSALLPIIIVYLFILNIGSVIFRQAARFILNRVTCWTFIYSSSDEENWVVKLNGQSTGYVSLG